MKDLLKSTTYFAEAVDADPSEAGKMLISAVKGFDLKMSNSEEVTDKLTTALNKSLLEVNELPHAIGELAGRAKMLGQSFDSSLVALMMGKDQGMNAAQTSQDFLHGLRQLSQIGNTDFMTPKRLEYFQKAGIDTSFFDKEKLQLKEFPEIIASLEKTLTNQGLMPNKENFYKVIDQNGGTIPDGLINKMAAMPMISKIFGAAGQAPLIMGLQSKYEEVDPETGEKTGQIYYGSDALKRMQQDLENSKGAVEKVHAEIGQTAKYQLEILSGTWQAAQIKLTDDFLPLVKSVSNELKNYIEGKGTAGALDRLDESIASTAENLRKTNPELANFVENAGYLATDATRVAGTIPTTAKQIGDAANKNLVNGDWGDSLLTMPYYAVKNGLGFVTDVMDENADFDKKVAELPPELQDSAKLTRSLIQGGVTLVAAGAIVKIIELAFRSASLLIKGGKIAFDAGKYILDMFTGAGKKSVMSNAGATMALNANIVNVYGKTITGGPGGVPTGGGAGGSSTVVGGGLPPRSETHGNKPSAGATLGGALLALTGSMAIGEIGDALLDSLNIKGEGGLSETGSMKWFGKEIINVKDVLGFLGINKPKGEDFTSASQFYKDTNNSQTLIAQTLLDNKAQIQQSFSDLANNNATVLTNGFNAVGTKLENIKVENKIVVNTSPKINISGDLQHVIKNTAVTVEDMAKQAQQEQFLSVQNRRFDNR